MSTDPWVADLTLAEVDAARRRGRKMVARLRFPLLALAGLHLCSAVWALTAGRHRIASFYGPGLIVVAAWSGWRARRDAHAHGVQVKVAPWLATAVTLLVLSAAVARWADVRGHRTVEVVGPAMVFALGIVAFGLWGRAGPVVGAGAMMVAVSMATPLVASGDAAVALQLVGYALVLVVAALRSNPTVPER